MNDPAVERAEKSRDLTRRSVVRGAAWSVPVIAVAIAAPAAAASFIAPAIIWFTNGPYAVAGCSVVPDMVVRLTTDGTTPNPAQPITVTLAAGLTWSDGTGDPRVFITDASGDIVVTGIATPAEGGDYYVSANFGVIPAIATVTVTPAAGSTC